MIFVFFANFALVIMKKALTRFLSLFLVAILVFANAGMVVVHHVCHSGHGVTVSFFEGNAQEDEPGCCCSGEETVCKTGNDSRVHFDQVPCCQEFVTYLKADLYSLPALKSAKSVFAQISGILPVLTFIEEVENSTAPTIIGLGDPSPPPSGRSIVISFHQLKIPAIS